MSGRDVDELDKIREKNQAEMHRLLQKQKAAVIQHSSMVTDTLRSAAASWREAKEHLVSLKKEESSSSLLHNFVVLNTPLFILPSVTTSPAQGITLDSWSKAPWNNVAKISAEWKTPNPDNGFADVSFVFVWQNPRDRLVVVNVDSYLTFNGFGVADATVARFTNLGVPLVDIHILELWNNPPTWNPPLFVIPPGFAKSGAGWVTAHGGIAGDYEHSVISDTTGVSHTQLLIPSKGVAVFCVHLTISHWTDGGYINVDFVSGSFEIMCPSVVITILS